ncbi:TonB family protein [Luteimonas mephitis]|uniref:TonB family protein n=1 Tax=Luteimonas mephitis TaxID=83615 RepID=UPI003A959B29
MTQTDLYRWLLESTCASSAAIGLVLLLRRPLRAAFGANVAYALWSLLPLAVLAASLPARVVRVLASEAGVTVGAGAVAGSAPLADVAGSAAWLLSAWLAGAIAFVLWQVALQRRFRRSLGVVHGGADGHLRAERSAGLPAVIGLRARIVLPADFEIRYSACERELILAHERIHLARRDVLGNALLAALRCVYWFNPLLWIAADRFRRDQELACDETVVTRHPHARRVYGEAMVKTQLSAMPAPLACHWFGGHPLKERIAMLKHPGPGARRIAVGLVFAGVLVAGTAYATWAARPAVRVVDAASAAAPSHQRKQAPRPVVARNEQTDTKARVDIQSRMMAPPKYPSEAVAGRITGKVVLIIDVAADGSVADSRVETSEPAGVFDQVTLDAVKNWKFEPAMENGKPVAGRIRVPVTFEMDRDEGAQAPAPGGNA